MIYVRSPTIDQIIDAAVGVGVGIFHYYINTLGPGARHANVDNVPLEEEDDADEGGDED